MLTLGEQSWPTWERTQGESRAGGADAETKKAKVGVCEKRKRARMLGRELYFTLLTREAHS